MMRIFKTRFVERYCKKEGITDKQLADAINRAEKGLIDADLGGGLIKQRIARKGKGKSGGWRTLIAFRKAECAVFLFGFAKSDSDNIGPAQEADLKSAATDILALTQSEIDAKIKACILTEVDHGKDD